MEKTNAKRILEAKKIKYKEYEYPHGEDALDAKEVANLIGVDEKIVFKTLVCKGVNYYVFLVPVNSNLDLKKAASVVREKRVELIPVKDLFSLTGYVRGGCSPIGMKKSFFTVVEESALENDTIIFSAGKIGYQIEMNPRELSKIIRVDFKSISY